jgi:hypothetical protein
MPIAGDPRLAQLPAGFSQNIIVFAKPAPLNVGYRHPPFQKRTVADTIAVFEGNAAFRLSTSSGHSQPRRPPQQLTPHNGR